MLGAVAVRTAVVAIGLLVGGCALVTRQVVKPKVDAKSWCDPRRGVPPDPTLGIATPIRIGIASVVHRQDGATESFAARAAWASTTWVPERQATLTVIDHPVDADYAISGDIAGELGYDHETRIRPGVAVSGYAIGYSVGGALLSLAAIFDAVGESNGDLWNAGLLVTSMALATHVYVGSRPANEYHWSQIGHFTLRRHGVRIGEFYIPNAGLETSWTPVPDFQKRALRPLWRKAQRAIGACIAADLGEAG